MIEVTNNSKLTYENTPTNSIKDKVMNFLKSILIHSSKNNDAESKLLKISCICFLFMILEFFGGYISNSCALMSDAAHLLSDLLGFFIGAFAAKLSKKARTSNFTFGYVRWEVIGAILSILLIWILT